MLCYEKHDKPRKLRGFGSKKNKKILKKYNLID